MADAALGLDRDALRAHWTLDPAVEFLNHGSFGACPESILDRQREWQRRIEREPVRFFVDEYPPALDAARDALAAFVGADAAGLVPVPNATTAVNSVLRGIDLGPGDELLLTDHGYDACRNAAEFVAARRGATVVTARIPFPLSGPDAVLEALERAISRRTVFALVDHVTSPTALVLPVERIVSLFADRGVDVMIDGAHAPGMLPLDIAALGAAYYTGNCHKWMCAPKGTAFLWVREDRRHGLRPLVISHGAAMPPRERSRYQMEFDWPGTRDPSGFLTLPALIETMGRLVPGGWDRIYRSNRALVIEGRRRVCEAIGARPPAPESMLGSMASVALPDLATPDGPVDPSTSVPPQRQLLERFAIEVPVFWFPAPPGRILRLSAQLYNAETQYAVLAGALAETLATE